VWRAAATARLGDACKGRLLHTNESSKRERGTEVKVTGSSGDVGSLGFLPIAEKVKAVEFVHSLKSFDWGILGVVASEAGSSADCAAGRPHGGSDPSRPYGGGREFP
jgi:hypothetical protein